MIMDSILAIIVNSLLVPGIVFIIIATWLTQWFYRKLYARMQNRIGPRFIGPRGLLQPLADFFKLLFKEDIVTVVSREKEPILVLSLAIGALVALLSMLPMTPYPLYAENDIILAIYLSFWPPAVLVLLGFMAPNPYTAIGTSRYMSLIIVCEPIWLVSILVPVVLATRSGVTPAYSIFATSLNSFKLWLNAYTIIPMILALFSTILVVQCKLMLKPFDIPEAETEIVAGPFTEYSGPKLAYIILLHDIELVVYGFLITWLFLGGSAPFTINSVEGILTLIIKYLVVVLIITWIKASTARFRIDQALIFMLKYVVPISIISLVLATLIPLH